MVLSHWSGEIIPSGVTIQPSIASVMEGETLDLNCIVPGTSPASVKWRRAGGLLSSNHQVYLRPFWSIFDLRDLISICVIRFLSHVLNIWTIRVLARCWGLSCGSCRPLQTTLVNISVRWRAAHPLARLLYLCLWPPAPPVSPLHWWQTGECESIKNSINQTLLFRKRLFHIVSPWLAYPHILVKR